MKVNLEKSRLFCSKNMAQNVQRELSDILGIARASNLGKYPRIPLLKGRVTRDVFAPVMERINSRLASWKNKLLNKAGRLCLAKSVLSSLPLYSMQALWLPESVCEFVDKKLRNCVWARGGNNRSWNLVGWKEIA